MATTTGGRGALLLGLVLASAAAAGQKTLVVAAGDCKSGELLTGMGAFADAVRERLKGDLLDGEVLLSQLRPRPSRSLDDIKRQVEQARTLFYAAQAEKARMQLKVALADLDKVSPQLKPWPTTVDALVTLALVEKELGHKPETTEAFRRVLRVDPHYVLDADVIPPSAVQLFEELRKEVARARHSVLQVQATAGATVFLDGAAVGQTPLRIEVLPGTYTMVLLHGDEVSFTHVVKVDKDVAVPVELPLEGALGTAPPLCLSGRALGLAVKLAAAMSSERVIVFTLESLRGDPANYQAALYVSGRRERMASVVPPRRDSEALGLLAAFITTGVEAPGIEALDLAKGVAPEQPAPEKAVAEPPPPRPPPPEVAAQPRGGSLARTVSVGLLIGGAAVAAGGVVVFAVGGADRDALARLIGADGKLPPPTSADHRKALDLMPVIDGNRTAAFALLGVGAGLALSGLVGFLLFPPDAPVALAVLPAPAGGLVQVSGRF